MSATKQATSKEGLRTILLKHGLDLDGTIGGSLVWEVPVKIFRSSRLTDVEIGAYSYISPKVEIQHATIGRYCSIGDNVNMRGSAHPKNWLSSHPFPYTNLYSASRKYTPPLTFSSYDKRTCIGHDVWIGSHVIILPGVTIGTGAIIGAGAVVAKDIPAYAIAVGNPAKVVKYRFDQPLIDRLLQSKWWAYDLPRHLEQKPDIPLDDPEKMLDYLEGTNVEVPRIAPERKIYSRNKNEIKIRTVAAGGS
ncbi:CatB-related O-acetyltransferase [Microvirga sp. 2YAF29]|uniref:CatB-related O-acetyltransferase n=1 Tax=Microvirga sp. 2YAF29 TaxID=3233031 RepID=UPI003F96E5A4